ncbi:hypothetical protein VTH06DRAFT_2609 [Thermothelomyces fergusii]
MHFSVTKEVGWEADDENDGPKPAIGVRKRYRFVLDFSRRSSKHRKEGKGIHVEPSESVGHNKSSRHHCYGCNAPRSERYQQEFPLRRGRKPRPSLCSRCRYRREIRVADRACDSKGRTDRLTARIDEREWCVSCGTLRSNEHHRKLLSGELSAWDEICGQCVIKEKRRGKHGRLRACHERQRVMDRGEDDQHGFCDHDSLQDRRSRPYAATPTSSHNEVELVLATTSTSDSRTRAQSREDGSFDDSGRAATKAIASEDARCDSANVGDIRGHASRSEAPRHREEQGWPARQRGKGGSGRGGPQQQNMCRESTEKPTGQPRLRDVPPLTAVNPPSRQPPKFHHDLAARQGEPNHAEKDRLPVAGSIADSTSRSGREEEGQKARNCFKPPHLEDCYNEHRQPKAKSRPEEPHKAPDVASFPARYQDFHESRVYFKLPQQQHKRSATHWRPTAADSKNQEEAGEQHSDGHGHQAEHASASPTTPSRSQQQDPSSFPLHNQDKPQPRPQPRPAASTDGHRRSAGHSSQSPRQAQPARPRRPQQQQQKEKQRPIGVSDRYWASERGRAERASAGGAGREREQVWEVDSDEADEIERDHARLVAVARARGWC